MENDDLVTAEIYRDVWRCVLSKILKFKHAEIENWMNESGEELLQTCGFHEVPWYWATGDVIRNLAPTDNFEGVDVSASTKKVFPILDAVFDGTFQNGIPEGVDWEIIRRRCEESIVMKGSYAD